MNKPDLSAGKTLHIVQLHYKDTVLCAEPFTDKKEADRVARVETNVLGWMEAFGAETGDFKIVTVELPLPVGTA